MNIKEDDLACKFESISRLGNYNGNYLAYGVLHDPIGSDNKDKDGFKLSGNCSFNLKK